MFKIPKQECVTDFKELAVKRVKNGQGIAQTLRNWVKAAATV